MEVNEETFRQILEERDKLKKYETDRVIKERKIFVGKLEKELKRELMDEEELKQNAFCSDYNKALLVAIEIIKSLAVLGRKGKNECI